MSNHNCHGDFFLADGFRYYRCFLNGEAVATQKRDGDNCPVCDRTIKAGHTHGECEVETIRFANVPDVGRVELPTPQ